MSDFAKRLAQLSPGSPLVNFPNKPRDVEILLQSLAHEFESGRIYNEASIDSIIMQWKREVGRRVEIDHVNIRRRLVDDLYLNRSRDGREYSAPERLVEAAVGESRKIIEDELDARAAKRRVHESD
jgi:hypothetical protein